MTPAVPDQQQGSNLIPGPRPPRLRGRQRSLLADPVHSRAYSLVGSAPTIVLRAADEAGRVAAEKKRTSIASSFASAGECEATCAGTDQLSASSTQDTTTQHETAAERSKRTERWWRVAAELRETERTYLDVLETIDELYYQPLLRMLPPLDPAGRLRRRASKRHSMPTWTSFSKLDTSPSVIIGPSASSQALNEAPPVAKQHALSHVDVERIFSNFPDILTLSRLLAETLQGVFADERRPGGDLRKSASITPSKLRLGRTLLPLLPFLKQYSVFLANYPAALQALAAVEREPSTDSQSGLRGVTSEQQQSWRSLVADARGKARQDPSRSSAINLNLSGLLLNIVQRVPRYRLLLAELIRFSDPETTDAADLRAAYKLVDGVATHLNDQIRQHEHDLRVLALQQRFERLAAPLLIPGRRLLKEANVQIYLQDIQGDQRCIFLFTDILLLARPRERVASPTLPKNTSTPLVEDLSISLADLTVAAGRERAFDSCASLDIFAADRAFSITTETRTERDAWLEAIRNAKLSQAAALSTLASPSEAAQETDVPNRPGVTPTRRPWSTPVTASEALTLRGQVAPPSRISDGAASGSPATTADSLNEAKAHLVSPTRLDDADTKVAGSKRTVGRSTAMRSKDGKRSLKQSLRVPRRHAYRNVQRLFVGGTGLQSPLSRAEHDPNVTDDADLGSRQTPQIDTYREPVWTPDRSARRCASCRQPFGLWRRRHHCRLCGNIFCWQCASEYFRLPVTSTASPPSSHKARADIIARACKGCFASVFCSATQKHSPRFLASRRALADPVMAKLPPTLRLRSRRPDPGSMRFRSTSRQESTARVSGADVLRRDHDTSRAVDANCKGSLAAAEAEGELRRGRSSAVDELRRLLATGGK